MGLVARVQADQRQMCVKKLRKEVVGLALGETGADTACPETKKTLKGTFKQIVRVTGSCLRLHS